MSLLRVISKQGQAINALMKNDGTSVMTLQREGEDNVTFMSCIIRFYCINN